MQTLAGPVLLAAGSPHRLRTPLRLQALPMLYLWEAKRKDRWASAAHHAATIILIAYSYYLK